MKQLRPDRDPDFAKGLLAGVAGGLLASFLMEQFQALWSKAAEEIRPGDGEKGSGAQEDPATVKTAQAISGGVMGKPIPKEKKPLAGEAVHYAMGATSGAIYGFAAELTPLATLGDGLAFGTGVWLAADNAIVPALGLAKPPTQTPPATHLYALASHLVTDLRPKLCDARCVVHSDRRESERLSRVKINVSDAESRFEHSTLFKAQALHGITDSGDGGC